MPLNATEAMNYVRPLTIGSKRALDKFVVADFGAFSDTTKGKATHSAYQAVWARHLAYGAAVKVNPGLAVPAGGNLKQPYKFSYDEGGDDNTPPTIKKVGGKIAAEIIGVGECAYFAGRAFGDLSGGKALQGKVAPLVQQVADPSIPHNFAMVNMDAPEEEWVMVDYWLYALGIPWKNCVCPIADVPEDLEFYKGKLKIIKTYNPNT